MQNDTVDKGSRVVHNASPTAFQRRMVSGTVFFCFLFVCLLEEFQFQYFAENDPNVRGQGQGASRG